MFGVVKEGAWRLKTGWNELCGFMLRRKEHVGSKPGLTKLGWLRKDGGCERRSSCSRLGRKELEDYRLRLRELGDFMLWQRKQLLAPGCDKKNRLLQVGVEEAWRLQAGTRISRWFLATM